MPEKLQLAVGLDAGSSRTRCVIGLVEDECLRLLGFGEAVSEGWTKSRIADQTAVANSMRQALEEAERMAGVSVESCVLGVGGSTVRGSNARSEHEMNRPRELDHRDVTRVVERASRVQLQEDRMLLQALLQDFVVDDHPGHRDPRRMVAARLEANVHLITVSEREHNRLVAAANQAHVAVEETVFEGFAAAHSVVLPDERREGVAVVDIGAHSTDLVVYYGDAVQIAASLPICGDHLTRDVARGLHLSFDDAACLKEEYGCATAGRTPLNSFIEVPPLPSEGREAREVQRRTLNQIIEARADELFRHVLRELLRVGMDQALMSGIVLTGGTARLHEVCDAAERVLQCQARKGLTAGIEDWPEEMSEPAWSTAAGLAMYSGRLSLRAEMENRAAGLLGRIFG
jgi:cell division protein FtsA